MGELRIELLEKYCTDSEESIEHYKFIMGDKFIPSFRYRRINPLISDILYIREIEHIKDESMVVFKSLVKGQQGHSIIVLGGYDDIWIKINDLENSIEDD